MGYKTRRNLRAHGVAIFYDTFEEANLWGEDLAEHLDLVYRRSDDYCVVFISQHYAKKMWTRHERRAALARALKSRTEYILPARIDETELPGIPHTMGYVSAKEKKPAHFAKLLLKKLGRQPLQSGRKKQASERRYANNQTLPRSIATPDRGRAGRVAGGGGRAEAPASRDRRRTGHLAPRPPRPRFQRGTGLTEWLVKHSLTA
jgi:hypothetical protein